MKTRLLFLITLVTFLLSGFLIYSGLNPPPQKSELTPNSPTPLATEASAEDLILGENTANESSTISTQTYLVTKVIDGDTIYVNIDWQEKSIRLIGVDTPETVDPRRPVGCFGKEASDKTKELLTNKKISLEKDVSDIDKYQRLLRYVYLPLEGGNSLFVNDYLVREGYAKNLTYPPDVKFNDRFKLAEREARENKRGLWGKCN